MKESKPKIGYMCGVDWQYELGASWGGNRVFPSPKSCSEFYSCTDECGIVEVEVRVVKWVKEQDLG